MRKYSNVLLRFSAVFALIGAFLGSHMAGSGSIAFKSVHAHILVVGWLTLFAWAVYYKLFTPAKTIVAVLHVWTAIIGTIGLTVGMLLYNVGPFNLADGFTTVVFIVGGSIMLLSFLLFAILTFMPRKEEHE